MCIISVILNLPVVQMAPVDAQHEVPKRDTYKHRKKDDAPIIFQKPPPPQGPRGGLNQHREAFQVDKLLIFHATHCYPVFGRLTTRETFTSIFAMLMDSGMDKLKLQILHHEARV